MRDSGLQVASTTAINHIEVMVRCKAGPSMEVVEDLDSELPYQTIEDNWMVWPSG